MIDERRVSNWGRAAQVVSFAVIGLATLILIYIGYLLLSPQKVLEVKTQPLPVSPATVRPGEAVNMEIDYCKFQDLDSRIQIDFVGEYVLNTQQTTRDFPTGCHKQRLNVIIPPQAKAGTYNLLFTVRYRVNSLHGEEYVFESQKFNIVQ
jgi:hypothetical protein